MTPTSPRAVLHHTDANLCTILHTTVTLGVVHKLRLQEEVGRWSKSVNFYNVDTFNEVVKEKAINMST